MASPVGSHLELFRSFTHTPNSLSEGAGSRLAQNNSGGEGPVSKPVQGRLPQTRDDDLVDCAGHLPQARGDRGGAWSEGTTNRHSLQHPPLRLRHQQEHGLVSRSL